jgi:pyruvate ferredoxin oxidoreductase gamma subunit
MVLTKSSKSSSDYIAKGANMIEMRFHGRGGQGAVTSAELVAQAAIDTGKYATAFPSFGPERRGAPVVAFARVDDMPVRVRSKVYNPDVVIVLDPSLVEITDPVQGLRQAGILIINSAKDPASIRKRLSYSGRLAVVDASLIAKEVIGLPITNTTMVGALLKGTDLLSIEALKGPFQRRFGKIAARNIEAMRRAWEETKIDA